MARLHVEKMRVLIERIVSGSVHPGEMLPKEVDLAEELQISRGTARECTRALEERGLVRVRHGRGAVVLPPERWDVLDPDVTAVLAAGRRGRRFREELGESRVLLLADAAGLAAAAATPESIGALEAAVERGRLEFARALARASGNRALALTLSRLLDGSAAAGWAGDGLDAPAVLAAVAAGDPEAARAAVPLA